MSAPAALNDDFNLTAPDAVRVSELAALVWAECGNDPSELELAPSRDQPAGSWLAGDKAADRLGWRAATPLRDGVRRVARRARAQREVTGVPQPSLRAAR
jgi:nucleoside-diphosphate-sugar epimerase